MSDYPNHKRVRFLDDYRFGVTIFNEEIVMTPSEWSTFAYKIIGEIRDKESRDFNKRLISQLKELKRDDA